MATTKKKVVKMKWYFKKLCVSNIQLSHIHTHTHTP